MPYAARASSLADGLVRLRRWLDDVGRAAVRPLLMLRADPQPWLGKGKVISGAVGEPERPERQET